MFGLAGAETGATKTSKSESNANCAMWKKKPNINDTAMVPKSRKAHSYPDWHRRFEGYYLLVVLLYACKFPFLEAPERSCLYCFDKVNEPQQTYPILPKSPFLESLICKNMYIYASMHIFPKALLVCNISCMCLNLSLQKRT